MDRFPEAPARDLPGVRKFAASELLDAFLEQGDAFLGDEA